MHDDELRQQIGSRGTQLVDTSLEARTPRELLDGHEEGNTFQLIHVREMEQHADAVQNLTLFTAVQVKGHYDEIE